jgi:hypothetical protein
LRHLERFGLVERVPPDEWDGGDRRNRPWRSRYTGYSIDPIAVKAGKIRRRAAYAVIAAGIERNTRLAEHYLRRASSLPAEWQEAAAFNTYGITVTASELGALAQAIDALVRPYLTPTRADSPADAEPVHVGLQAFRRLGTA